MRLAGAVTQGSGTVNEDGFGYTGSCGDVSAAWVFDGVTGINRLESLPAGSDAQWLVGRAHHHLLAIGGTDGGLPEILEQLVSRLIADWTEVTRGLSLPPDHDPPAACLILAKRYGSRWKALRLGDSCLMTRNADAHHSLHVASPSSALDHWLTREACKRRDAGMLDTKALLAEFRPQLFAGRRKRNQRGGYSILECSAAALAMPEYIELGQPQQILLCTDGYYRAVDHYGLHDPGSLIEASSRSVEDVVSAIRKREAGDPGCIAYPRFKPADDATAVMLSR